MSACCLVCFLSSLFSLSCFRSSLSCCCICLSSTFTSLPALAPAVSWPNAIPSLPVSHLLPHQWICRAVNFDPMVFLAVLPLRWLRAITLQVVLASLSPLHGHHPLTPFTMNSHLFMDTLRNLHLSHSLRPQTTNIHSLLFPPRITHFNAKWNRDVANSMPISSLKLLILRIKRPNLPITGVAISISQKRLMTEIGIIIIMMLRTAQNPYKDQAWMIQIPSPPMSTLLRHLSRFTSWPPFSGTFSTMTEMPTWQYSNDSRTQTMIWQDIRSRSSRQQTWLTLLVIWQNPLAPCQIKPFEWRHFLTSAIEPEHRGVLSCRNNSAADFFPVFWSCVNRYIQLQGTNKSFANHSENGKK